MKTTKRQQKFLDKLYANYTDTNNIYPKSMSDSEFIKLITDYFLGEDYYIASPVSQGQANVIIAIEIIRSNRHWPLRK